MVKIRKMAAFQKSAEEATRAASRKNKQDDEARAIRKSGGR
jgi:hypothetical protein